MDNLLSLLTMPISMHHAYHRTFKAGLYASLKNGTLNDLIKTSASESSKIRIGNYKQGTLAIQTADDWDITDPHLPENSIAVITVEGVIYPYLTYRIENFVKAANENPNIIGILFFVNTPGGYVLRNDITSAAIKNSKKPTAAYVTGLCTSAGMWLFSGVKRIFASSPLDVFGSIGMMTTFMDDSKFWEDMGITMTDVYATLSTLKNDFSREAEKGNFDLIRADLDFTNQLFHQTISDNLGIAIDNKNEVFLGTTFNAEEAIKRGLAHEMSDFDGALNWTLQEGYKFKANNNQF